MPEKKPLTKKWWFWAIIVVLVLGLFGAIGGGGKDGDSKSGSSGTSSSTTPSAASGPSSGSAPSAASDPSSASTLSASTDPSPEPATPSTPAKTTFGVGDTQTTGKYTVTLQGYRESKGTNQFLLPEDGKIFILFEFLIENTGSTDAAISTLTDFDCYVDDFAVEYSLSAATEEKGDLDVTIAPGKKAKGEIGFEVDKDWKTIEIIFDPTFAIGKGVTYTITR